MNRKFIFLLSFVVSFTSANAQKQTKRPNIIFILADDLGYTDVGGFAKKATGTPVKLQFYETPNIDRMMKEGTSFSQAYVNPLCSPRCMLCN